MCTISEAMKFVVEMCGKAMSKAVTVLSELQGAMGRIHSDKSGPRQALVLWMMRWEGIILK